MYLQKISSSVEMKDNATGDVKITYYSSCLTNGPEIKTNKCSGLKVGDKVTFTAQITVTKCPAKEENWNQVCRQKLRRSPSECLINLPPFFFVSDDSNLSSWY